MERITLAENKCVASNLQGKKYSRKGNFFLEITRKQQPEKQGEQRRGGMGRKDWRLGNGFEMLTWKKNKTLLG